jgi:hypothetical protein
MILFGTLPPPILKVQGMAFQNIPIKNDEWLNPFHSMVQNFLDPHKIMKTSTCNFVYDYLLDSFPTMPPLELRLIMATILKELGLKLLIDPWDGFNNLGVEPFGTIWLPLYYKYYKPKSLVTLVGGEIMWTSSLTCDSFP